MLKPQIHLLSICKANWLLLFTVYVSCVTQMEISCVLQEDEIIPSTQIEPSP